MEVLQNTYKDTKIGRIPKDWEVKTLEDVFIFNNGKGHEQFISENGDYIVVNSKFISQEGRVKKFSNKQMSPLLVKDITMVMSDIPNGRALAKCFLIEENNKYSLNQRICGLRLKNEANDDVRFFFYNLNRNKGFLKYNDGVSQTNLRKSEVLGCLLAYPPSKEQKKIAAILSTVDEQISTTDKIIEKSKELKKGLMQKLFSEGIGHTEFKDTKIGRIPKDWEVVKIREINEHSLLGGNYKNGEGEKGIPLIKMGNLDRGKIKLNKVQNIPETLVYDNIHILKEGDFLFNTRNTLELVGKVAIWRNELPKALYNSNLLKIDFNKSKVHSTKFMNYVFNSDLVIKKLRGLATGSTSVAAIYNKDLFKLKVPLPPLPEQQKIAAILSEADAKIEKELTQKSQLETLKKGLMQQLLTGKKRVKV